MAKNIMKRKSRVIKKKSLGKRSNRKFIKLALQDLIKRNKNPLTKFKILGAMNDESIKYLIRSFTKTAKPTVHALRSIRVFKNLTFDIVIFEDFISTKPKFLKIEYIEEKNILKFPGKCPIDLYNNKDYKDYEVK